MEKEGLESRKSRKEQERERRRLKDRERRQSMSQDERERHLAKRRKNYQLRRQRAEISRLDSQIQAFTGAPLTTSPPDSGAISLLLLEPEDQSVGMIQLGELSKLMGTIRLSRLKHVARTLKSTGGAEASNTGEITRRAMSSGLRLSRVKQLVRSKGQQKGVLLLPQSPKSQGLELHQSCSLLEPGPLVT